MLRKDKIFSATIKNDAAKITRVFFDLRFVAARIPLDNPFTTLLWF
jgi:hypothetical protein